MTKIKAIAFDMDGLMFNTEDIYDEVGQIVLSKRGKDFTNDLKLKMMGLPHWAAFEVMKTECELDDTIETLEQEANEAFAKLLPEKIEMLPGLEKLLSHLESENIPKAIATSSVLRFAKLALDRFDLLPRFEFILTAEDVTEGKPHPEIYQTAARRLGVATHEMMVLEDSVIGSTAAAAAGALTIAVPGQHSQDGDFDHVDHLVDSLESPDIITLLDGLRCYQVELRGRNFLVALDSESGEAKKKSFTATRYVRAVSHDDAEFLAVKMLRDLSSLRELVQNSDKDRPEMTVIKSERLDSLDGIEDREPAICWE